MTRELLSALFLFLTLISCDFEEKESSNKQNVIKETQASSQTSLDSKESEYYKIRDRYVNYFEAILKKDYDQTILDAQNMDSLLVLEKMLKEILKGASINGISKDGKINLETLLPEMGFGGLDGLVLNKNSVDKNAPEIVVTSKSLFFNYFKGDRINSLDSLTTEQLNNIFTSALGRGEVHATTFSILRKSLTKSGQTYGCIGNLGQESGDLLPPDCILVLVLNKGYIYILTEYLNVSIQELGECQSISDSLYLLSTELSQQYDASFPKDKSLLYKATDFQQAAWEQYCNCYDEKLKDKEVFEKIVNQVISVMQIAQK